MEEERRVALEALAEKSQQVQDLQKHMAELEETLTQRFGLLIWFLVRHETSEHPPIIIIFLLQQEQVCCAFKGAGQSESRIWSPGNVHTCGV